MSHKDEALRRIREQVEASKAAQAGKPSVLGEALESAYAKKESVDPWFTDEPSDIAPAGMVRLSSLVATWDHAAGTMDPYVRVFDAADHAESVRQFVPAVQSGYRPNQAALAQLAYAIDHTDLPAWLTGKPSVGKSSVVQYFCAITGRPFRRVNFNGNVSTDSLLGKQSLTASEHGTVTQWHEGIIPEAMQIPHCVCLLDEVTAGPAEVQLSLQYALERGGRLLLLDKPATSGDAFVDPAKGFRFLMADNTTGQGDSSGRYVATQPQNTAWLDRVGTFITVDWLAEKDEAAMLRGLYPAMSDKLALKIVRVANSLRSGMEQGSFSVVASMRVTQAWAMHACNLRDIKQAFELAYIARIDSDSEKDAAREVFRAHFGFFAE